MAVQISTDSTVAVQISTDNTMAVQISTDSTMAVQISTDSTVAVQISTESTMALQISTDSTMSLQISTDSTIALTAQYQYFRQQYQHNCIPQQWKTGSTNSSYCTEALKALASENTRVGILEELFKYNISCL
jgi:hypothetical protein